MEFLSVDDDEATLSATFRSFADVFSPRCATIDVEPVNFSKSSISKRLNSQELWLRYDGLTKMVSAFTKDTEEDKTHYESFRCPDGSYRSRVLSNGDNAIVGYATNILSKIQYHNQEFPPPLLSADLVFVPNSVSMIKQFGWFSCASLTEHTIVMKKEQRRRIGPGTLFILVKRKKEVEWIPGRITRKKVEVFLLSGEIFEVWGDFAVKLQATYGNQIPDELVHFMRLIQGQEGASFETYLTSSNASTRNARSLMSEIILGNMMNFWKPEEIERLCGFVGSRINDMANQGLGHIVNVLGIQA